MTIIVHSRAKCVFRIKILMLQRMGLEIRIFIEVTNNYVHCFFQKNETDLEKDRQERAEAQPALMLEEDLKEASNIEDQRGSTSGKKKKNRCLTCKKKVGLTGFTCRCGGLFCSLHRYSDEHACDFDYKKLGAEEIKKSNPLIIAKKVEEI